MLIPDVAVCLSQVLVPDRAMWVRQRAQAGQGRAGQGGGSLTVEIGCGVDAKSL